MSRVGLDLSKFKKIKEDKKSAVLQHPEGHQITIAKHVLSNGFKEQLSKLPMHLSSGGSSGSITDDLLSNAENSLQQKAKSEGLGEERDKASSGYSANFPEAKPVQMAQANQAPQQPQQPTIVINNTPPPSVQPNQMAQANQAPQQPQPAQAQVAQADPYNPVLPNVTQQIPNQFSPQNDPYGSQAYGAISKEGLKNQVEGIQETAKAQNDQNQAIAEVRGSGADTQQQQLNDYTSRTNYLRNEYDSMMSDARAGHIDPNHYLSSMGVGQKIATVIGLILGGAGSGVTHQANPVSEFLNSQIQNDIKAQEKEMDKKQNLLSANMQHFGNMRDAVQMTEAMQRGIIANRIEETALKTGNPILIARAKQASGQLELQNNQLFSQIAVRQSLEGNKNPNQGESSQGKTYGQTMDPSTKIRMMSMTGIMSPQQAEGAQKELKESEDMGRTRDNLLQAFDQVNNINTIGSRVNIFSKNGGPLQTSRQVDAIIDPLVAALSKETAGRFTEQDAKYIRSLFPSAGDSEETSRVKRSQLEKIISQKMNFPILKAYNIEPSNSLYKSGGDSKVTELPPVLPK